MRRLAILGLLGLVLAACGGDRSHAPSPAERADAAAARFLDRYVDPDGRVVRRDQGGDTVSEGQAYALLLAAGVGDRARFERVWTWTRRHLQRPDGLLAYRWQGGRVADAEPAADADLDAARALLLAAERFNRQAYRQAGLRLARGILAHETAAVGDGTVLVAGPWGRSPVVVNPSYFAPRAYETIAAASGDRRWSAVAGSSRALLARLTTPNRLPPDWARLDRAGAVRASGPPSATGEMPRYGFDAVRVPARLAESCRPDERAMAARLWPLLKRGGSGEVVELTVDGDPLSEARNGASLAGAAAAAHAAGDERAALRLLDAAEAQDRRQPTYYGAAWIALTRLSLDTSRLGGCE